MSRITLALSVLMTLIGASGCSSLTAGTYQDAVGRWRAGDPAGATSSARKMYEKIRDANGVSEAVVAEAAQGALTELEEMPVLTKTAPPRPRATPKRAAEGGPDELVMELRGDMLSKHVTAVIRATAVVRDFGLVGEYATLLAIVYRREPLTDDGGVLVGANTALRSLAAKWVALTVLDRFAKGGVVRRGLPLPIPSQR